MAVTVTSAEKYLPILDGVYKKQSLTAVLDSPTQLDFSNTNTIKVMKVTTTGLGDYSKANGYAKGNATLEWETLTLSEDRSAELTVDRMDNDAALGQAFGMITNEFMRTNVAAEVDAFRFSTYASATGIGTASAALSTGEAVVAAVRAAITAMDEAEVPAEDRYLFITPTLYGIVQDLDTTKSREVFKRFAGVVEVPQTRFYTDITLNSGAEAWGYTKAEDAKDINFMIVSKSAVAQVMKFALPKIFDPDTNQSKDSWLFQYRHFHDAFTFDKKLSGIYVHKTV